MPILIEQAFVLSVMVVGQGPFVEYGVYLYAADSSHL